jgi:hypothetical protein
MRKIASIISILTASALIAGVATVALGSRAHAEASSLPYGHGGMPIAEVDSVIQQYNATGELFRIEGECRSSCTELLAIRHVCVDPNATLEFHAALLSPRTPVNPARNQRMASHYNSRLRSFVLANHYMDSWTFHPISGQDIIHKFGYRQCPTR